MNDNMREIMERQSQAPSEILKAWVERSARDERISIEDAEAAAAAARTLGLDYMAVQALVGRQRRINATTEQVAAAKAEVAGLRTARQLLEDIEQEDEAIAAAVDKLLARKRALISEFYDRRDHEAAQGALERTLSQLESEQRDAIPHEPPGTPHLVNAR